MISCTRSFGSLASNILYNKHANSQCKPSYQEINSLLNVKPYINPIFFNHKIALKLPENKIPSTDQKATKPSAKDAFTIQRKTHSTFFLTHSTVSKSWNNRS